MCRSKLVLVKRFHAQGGIERWLVARGPVDDAVWDGAQWVGVKHGPCTGRVTIAQSGSKKEARKIQIENLQKVN